MKKVQAAPVLKRKKGKPILSPATKVVRKQKRVIPTPSLSVSTLRAQMMNNASAYAESLKHPFALRNLRLPEAGGFPTTTGFFIQRFTRVPVDDSVAGPSVIGLWINANLAAAGSSSPPINSVTAIASGAPTWTSSTWSNNATMASNFQLARVTSLGIRFINSAPLLNRGGICYVSTVSSQFLPSSASAVTQILSSSETEQFDVASIPMMGDEFTWTPLQLRPQQNESYELTANLPNFLTFHVPATVASLMDNALFLYFEVPTSDDGGMAIDFEIGVNYEAIPFPQNDFLFHRELVVGSVDDLAVAAEAMALSENKSSSTASSFSVAESGLNSRPRPRGIRAAYKSRGYKQAPSALRPGSFGAPSAVSSLDYSNHQLACSMGVTQESPLHEPTRRDMPLKTFLLHILDLLSKHEDPELKESALFSAGVSESQKPRAPPSSVASTPSASAYAQRALPSLLGGEPDWAYVRSRLTIAEPLQAPQK
jgi:hypothetical protein